MNSAKQLTPERILQNLVGAKTEKKYCPVHGEYNAIVEKSGFTTKCQKCIDAKIIEERSLSQKKPMPPCHIPKRFMASRVENFKATCPASKNAVDILMNYLGNIDFCVNSGTSLVLCGDIGSGKTHMACAVGHAFMKMGKSVRYTTTYQAVASVKETYRGGGKTEMQVIKEFQEYDLLILDEVGVQFGTDAEKIIIYQIINGRYEEMKPMIIVSNLNEQGLSEYIGDRCVDRLRDGEGAVIPFTWGSHRSKRMQNKRT